MDLSDVQDPIQGASCPSCGFPNRNILDDGGTTQIILGAWCLPAALASVVGGIVAAVITWAALPFIIVLLGGPPWAGW